MEAVRSCNLSWIRDDDEYPRCVWDYDCASKISANCTNNSCRQFCRDFKDVLPFTYMSFSFVSALCCLIVFGTYFAMPRLRRTGYSSKVFLNR